MKAISAEAKILYGLMLDRMGLSMRNRWLDEENRVYIKYPMEEIMEDLGCGRNKAVALAAELDTVKGVGLIEKRRKGLGEASWIYVKNFMTITRSLPRNRHRMIRRIIWTEKSGRRRNQKAFRLRQAKRESPIRISLKSSLKTGRMTCRIRKFIFQTS